MENHIIVIQLDNDMSLHNFKEFAKSFNYSPEELAEECLQLEYLFLGSDTYPKYDKYPNHSYASIACPRLETLKTKQIYFLTPDLMNEYISILQLFNTSLDNYISNKNDIKTLSQYQIDNLIKTLSPIII